MMQEEKKATEEKKEQELSLNDDRRVKVLSPGALVAKRFFRNRLAVVGLTMLVVMFVFSFIGGLVSPYGQDEQFYTYTHMDKEYVGVVKNNDLRYTVNDGQEFGSILQAQLMLAIGKNADGSSSGGAGVHRAEEGKRIPDGIPEGRRPLSDFQQRHSAGNRSKGHRKRCRRRRDFCIDFRSQA